MATSPAAAARGGLRTLLRAVRETFAGDAAALTKSRAEVRKQFRANAGEADAARAARLVADAHDAAAFLKESIVQAKLNKSGRYGEGEEWGGVEGGLGSLARALLAGAGRAPRLRSQLTALPPARPRALQR